MDKPVPHPSEAVTGLAEILHELGEELNRANKKIGEQSWETQTGEVAREPILFLQGATVELAITTTKSAEGGVKVWVVNAGVGIDVVQTGKITINLNTGGQAPGVGQ